MKTLPVSAVADVARAGGGAGGGAPNVKGVDEVAGFADSVGGGFSVGRLGVAVGIGSTGFVGASNMKGEARDGAVAGGLSSFFSNLASPDAEDVTVESSVGGVITGVGCDGAPNNDGVASAALGAGGARISDGFDSFTTKAGEDEIGRFTDLPKTEELAKKFGTPEDVDATLNDGAIVAGWTGACEVTLTVSGVGGMSDIVGRARAEGERTVTGATFSASDVGSAGAGVGVGADTDLVRENGREVIGGSFALLRSWVMLV